MITLLILWALADSQDEANRLLRMTPAQLAKKERTEIRILLSLIVLVLVAVASRILFCYLG